MVLQWQYLLADYHLQPVSRAIERLRWRAAITQAHTYFVEALRIVQRIDRGGACGSDTIGCSIEDQLACHEEGGKDVASGILGPAVGCGGEAILDGIALEASCLIILQ